MGHENFVVRGLVRVGFVRRKDERVLSFDSSPDVHGRDRWRVHLYDGLHYGSMCAFFEGVDGATE